jgi:hypothetical protein
MANNVAGLKAAIRQAFIDNLDATTRTKLADRYVLRFQTEWNARVAGGTADTQANRAIFASDKLFDSINWVYSSGDRTERTAALPAPETIT